jgi:hypothetical protein
MFNNENQLLSSSYLSLEMKKKIIKSCIWSVAVYGSEKNLPITYLLLIIILRKTIITIFLKDLLPMSTAHNLKTRAKTHRLRANSDGLRTP